MRYLFISSTLGFFLVSAYCTVSYLLQPQSINVIVLTVESLRNDLVTRQTTPHLLEAAQAGTRFLHHRAVSGWTASNIVSLLTGLSPFESGVHTRGQSVDSDRNLPLEMLAESGYQVEGIQGFMLMDIYRDFGLQVKAEVHDLLYCLSLKAQSRKPFFTWYHYVHTHLPYTAPDGYETRTSQALLDHELPQDMSERLFLVQNTAAIHHDKVAFQPDDIPLIHELQHSTIREFDYWFRQFWEVFIKTGLRRNTILVVTADHGDEHGERGLVGHASTTLQGHFHEEIIRIPLFIWLPPGLEIHFPDLNPELVSTHEDIMPTLLALLDKTPAASFKGRYLYGSSNHSTWMAMTSSGGFAEPQPDDMRYFEYAMISGRWKLRYRTDHKEAHSFWLYDLADDAGERDNIAARNPGVVDELYGRLSDQIRTRTVLRAGPVRPSSQTDASGDEPVWLHPRASRTFHYDDLRGDFKLEWSGSADKNYVLEYIAGNGEKQISGFLDIEGPSKDFGKISSRYWNTWIVQYSPFRLRVSEKGGDKWSDWLDLEVRP